MRQRTPLVVALALVVVVGGLGLGELVPEAGAQADDPIEEVDHDREYKDRGDDGYVIRENGYLLLGNGRFAGGTVEADLTDQYNFEAGNKKEIDFTVRPPNDSEAEVQVIASYNNWITKGGLPPLSPINCVKGSDIGVVLENASGDVIDESTDVVNNCDTGTINIYTPAIPEGQYTAEIYMEYGASLINSVKIQVFF